jgi:hypothetical protein
MRSSKTNERGGEESKPSKAARIWRMAVEIFEMRPAGVSTSDWLGDPTCLAPRVLVLQLLSNISLLLWMRDCYGSDSRPMRLRLGELVVQLQRYEEKREEKREKKRKRDAAPAHGGVCAEEEATRLDLVDGCLPQVADATQAFVFGRMQGHESTIMYKAIRDHGARPMLSGTDYYWRRRPVIYLPCAKYICVVLPERQPLWPNYFVSSVEMEAIASLDDCFATFLVASGDGVASAGRWHLRKVASVLTRVQYTPMRAVNPGGGVYACAYVPASVHDPLDATEALLNKVIQSMALRPGMVVVYRGERLVVTGRVGEHFYILCDEALARSVRVHRADVEPARPEKHGSAMIVRGGYATKVGKCLGVDGDDIIIKVDGNIVIKRFYECVAFVRLAADA